ncbi:MAG: APC family permease [Acidimicrobiales bacterium]
MDQLRMPTDELKRQIGPGLLTLYGVGVMVGAGIYVLVGAVAGNAGVFAPLAFLFAGVIAAPTAFSYAELSIRVPESAGEAAFVRRAFGSNAFSVFVGLAIAGVGITSAAAVLQGGVGYLQTFVTAVDSRILIVAIGLVLVAIALWGVLESLAIAGIFTLVEVTGLMIVVWVGFDGQASNDWNNIDAGAIEWGGLGLAAVLAFFAFIGFEDMVNMVEEVKRPERTMPVAIISALVITCLLYGAVSIATVRTVEIDALADSDSPLALVYETATGRNPSFLAAIAVAAALNGVLAQIVMAARVLFGLGRRNEKLAIFHHSHPRLGTPVLATGLIGFGVIIGALTLDLAVLAEVTSTFLLVVFLMVNAALIQLKRANPSPGFSTPLWVPFAGLIGAAVALAITVLT